MIQEKFYNFQMHTRGTASDAASDLADETQQTLDKLEGY